MFSSAGSGTYITCFSLARSGTNITCFYSAGSGTNITCFSLARSGTNITCFSFLQCIKFNALSKNLCLYIHCYFLCMCFAFVVLCKENAFTILFDLLHMRGGRPTTKISRPSHILLISSSKPPRDDLSTKSIFTN